MALIIFLVVVGLIWDIVVTVVKGDDLAYAIVAYLLFIALPLLTLGIAGHFIIKFW